jgi:elongation factor P
VIVANDIKKGMMIKLDGELYMVVDFHHLTPGNKPAMIQAKLKSMRVGNVIQNRFRSTERVEDVYLDHRDMEYLYNDGDMYCLMDSETMEQLFIPKEVLGDTVNYMPHNCQVRVTFYEGRPVSAELPASVVLEVKETDPGVKGDTVTNVFKPATLETGVVIKVPLFINPGDRIKVDTRSGEFLSRA